MLYQYRNTAPQYIDGSVVEGDVIVSAYANIVKTRSYN